MDNILAWIGLILHRVSKHNQGHVLTAFLDSVRLLKKKLEKLLRTVFKKKLGVR